MALYLGQLFTRTTHFFDFHENTEQNGFDANIITLQNVQLLLSGSLLFPSTVRSTLKHLKGILVGFITDSPPIIRYPYFGYGFNCT
jgi:hypothetical protein